MICVPDPCKFVQCPHRQVCFLNARSEAECGCPFECPADSYHPVCGDDNLTYRSECEIRRNGCLLGHLLSKKHDGPCYQEYEAHHNNNHVNPSIDTVNNMTNSSQSLSSESNPSRDHHPHPSKTSLSGSICSLEFCPFYALCSSVAVHTGGETNNVTDSTSSVSTSNPLPNCICPSCTSDAKELLCGSDGVTYASECELQRTSCLSSRFIYAAHRGECS